MSPALALCLVVPAADAVTPLSQLRYTPDITVSLGGRVIGPADVANDTLSGLPTLALAALPASVAAYHFTGTAHWLVFDTTVALTLRTDRHAEGCRLL